MLKGVMIAKETLKDWQNQIKNSTAPSLLPDITEHKLDGKTIIAIHVEEMPLKPVSFKGRYYRRTLNANTQMTVSEMMDLHLRSFNTSWDYQIDPRHSLDDILLDKVSRFITMVNKHRATPITDKALEALRKFELLRNDAITNACYLLFTKDDSLLTTIEMGRFQTETIIKDSLRTQSDLFTQIETVIDFILKHINKRIIISGKAQHDEIWDYPLEAIRETVINAIIHRDYRSAADTVIKIFDDKIEIFNPGKLQGDLTISKLLSGDYVSMPRNKQIASVFKEAEIIEKYGSGIKRIRTSMINAGNPEPKFEEIGDGFRVTLFVGQLPITLPITPPITPPIKNGILQGLDERILELLKINNKMSAANIAKRLGIGRDTVKEYFSKLKAKGLIRRVGSSRAGYWKIS
jgi:ATP-dependent DNA helicase RecG